MRIISGIYKSRILNSPDSINVRPTADRAKETLFNILNNIIDFDGLVCLDLFCGTGNLGLECISRGALTCYFVNKDVNLVLKNIELLKAEDYSTVIKSDVMTFLNSYGESMADLVFCDPPYDYQLYDILIEKISLLKTVLILEHSDKFILKNDFVKHVILKKKVGTVNFTFFDFN